MEIIKNPNYDFIGKAKYFVAMSLFFILSGVGLMALHGIAYGVEFSGGTIVIVQFDRAPEVDQVRAALDRAKVGGGGQTGLDDPTAPEPSPDQPARVSGTRPAEFPEPTDARGMSVSELLRNCRPGWRLTTNSRSRWQSQVRVL